ncbi:MAG TPA: peptidyl-alpha-hydroxyglycine alpha-amidating lyase family protein [Bryobacteraceae bacterium]|jgi:DNA-binding beta-propeller fold protein YncE|nr:peptidyl-alpha-hydroxyglycine alpha-amidating lyase family protein [Bryobacteraceae bacterium]
MSRNKLVLAILFTGACLFTEASLFAQRPSDPKLMEPQKAPEMDYAAVADPLPLPEGMKMGASASVAFDSKGHLYVLTRGPQALVEFDENGKFLRAFGEGFRRTHGLRIDRDGNIWVTDVGAHIVVKMNPQGQVLLTIGTKDEPGEWNETTQSHHLNEPNDLAFNRAGDVFIVQGHTPGKGDPRVLKFDKNGNFKKSWGGLGAEPGQFNVAHGIAFDAKGQMWVADRENERIQIFDDDGKFIREIKYAGLPCGLEIGNQYIYMVNGFAGQLLRLDLNGNVLAAVGKSGKGVGEFGEAHYVAVSPKGEIYVADTVNRAVQKFVRK